MRLIIDFFGAKVDFLLIAFILILVGFFLIKSKGVFALDAKQSSFRPVAIFASGYFASSVDARLLLVKISWHIITVFRAITIIALSALLDLVLEFLFMLLVD